MLKVVKEKDFLRVYDLGYSELDEIEEVFSAKYNVNGSTDEVEIIKYLINYIYDYKINPLKYEFTKAKGRFTRAVDNIARYEKIKEDKMIKLLDKIRENRRIMKDLEFEICEYKTLVSSLYSSFPEEYSKRTYLDKLNKEKLALEKKINNLESHISVVR